MRTLFALLMVMAACSSSSEEECPIVGTYTVVGAAETGNTCPDSVNKSTVYTISSAPNGYAVAIQGVQGSCMAEASGTCKIQGKCDVLARNPTQPGNDRGTLQYSWTFTSAGFKGPMTVTIPPSDGLPGGCAGTSSQTGVRQ